MPRWHRAQHDEQSTGTSKPGCQAAVHCSVTCVGWMLEQRTEQIDCCAGDNLSYAIIASMNYESIYFRYVSCTSSFAHNFPTVQCIISIITSIISCSIQAADMADNSNVTNLFCDMFAVH